MYQSLLKTLCFLVLCSCDSPKQQKLEEKSPPNIIFILSDDQAWGDYSFMDHPHIQTPNIDQLAKESATYQRLCDQSTLWPIFGEHHYREICFSTWTNR